MQWSWYLSLSDILPMFHANFSHEQVRAMFDDRGGRVDEAGPSMAVQVFFSYTSVSFVLLLICLRYLHHSTRITL